MLHLLIRKIKKITQHQSRRKQEILSNGIRASDGKYGGKYSIHFYIINAIKKICIVSMFLLCGVNNAFANINNEDNPLTFPHWVIGCDNNNICDAVGYPYKDSDVSNNSIWYIYIRWNAETREFLNFYLKPTWGAGAISLFCGLQENKPCINLLPYSKKQNVDDRDIYDLKIDRQLLNDINAITIQLDEEPKTTWTLDLTDFKLFYSTHKVLVPVQAPEAILAYPWYNYKDLNESDNKKLLKEHLIDYMCDNNNGFSFEVDNLKLIAACNNDGYNPSYKIISEKNTSKSLPLISSKMNGVQSRYNLDGFVAVNDTVGLSLDPDDRYKFYARTIGRALGDCGIFVTFVYDGKQFQIIEIKSMPVCNYIDVSDWPVIYSMPIKKHH